MPRTSRTDYVILGLLTSGPRTGYELKQEIDEVVGHFWRESYGQIYPVLRRLTAAGLTIRRAERGGRRVVRYRLTARGRARLSAWLAKPPEPELPRRELLLKIFFGAGTSPAVLRSHVSAMTTQTRAFLALLARAEREVEAEDRGNRDVAFWRMTVRAGQYVGRARLRWARETDAALAALEAR